MSDIVAFKAGSTTPAEITAAFKKFDTNGDGFLSKNEIVKILTRQGGGNALDEGDAEDFAEQYITECDANGDGKISLEEFTAAMTKTSRLFEAATFGKGSKGFFRRVLNGCGTAELRYTYNGKNIIHQVASRGDTKSAENHRPVSGGDWDEEMKLVLDMTRRDIDPKTSKPYVGIDDIDPTSAYGETALIIAAMYGRTDTVKVLIECGANRDLMSEKEGPLGVRTAEDWARRSNFGPKLTARDDPELAAEKALMEKRGDNYELRKSNRTGFLETADLPGLKSKNSMAYNEYGQLKRAQ